MSANQTQDEASVRERDRRRTSRACSPGFVGPDKAVVRVSADMNFDQKQTKAETFEPAPSTATTAAVTGGAAGPDRRDALQETASETYNGGVVPPPAIGATRQQTASAAATNTTAPRPPRNTRSAKDRGDSGRAGTDHRLSVAVLVDKSVPSSQISKHTAGREAAAGVNTGTRRPGDGPGCGVRQEHAEAGRQGDGGRVSKRV